MTDKQGVTFDAASQAIRMERLEGEGRLLQSQVKNSIDNMTATMQAVQADVRGVVNKVSDFSDLRIAHEQDRATMNRIENTLRELGAKFDSKVERMERESEERWVRHEADNENSERDLQQQIDAASASINDMEKRFSRAVGWVSGLSVLAGLLMAGFLWAVNFRFEDIKDDVNKIDPIKDKLQQIELYLARGGQRPADTYVPQTQPEKNQ